MLQDLFNKELSISEITSSNRTQPWNGEAIPSLSRSLYTPGKIKEAQQIGWLIENILSRGFRVSLSAKRIYVRSRKRVYWQIYHRKGFIREVRPKATVCRYEICPS